MRKLLLIFAVMLIIVLPIAMADIIVFTTYDTRTTLDKGHLKIERDVVLKNVGGAPIIPGELHFKLREITSKGTYGPAVKNLEAHDQYSTELKIGRAHV